MLSPIPRKRRKLEDTFFDFRFDISNFEGNNLNEISENLLNDITIVDKIRPILVEVIQILCENERDSLRVLELISILINTCFNIIPIAVGFFIKNKGLINSNLNLVNFSSVLFNDPFRINWKLFIVSWSWNLNWRLMWS